MKRKTEIVGEKYRRFFTIILVSKNQLTEQTFASNKAILHVHAINLSKVGTKGRFKTRKILASKNKTQCIMNLLY